MATDIEGRQLEGEFLANGQNREHDVDQLALLFPKGPRGAGSGHGRKAGRTSESEGRGRNLERFDGKRESDGKFNCPSAQHYNVRDDGCKVNGDLTKKITVDVKGEVPS